MATADVGTCNWLVDELTRARLLERSVVQPLADAFQQAQPYADATSLGDHLVQAGLLTSFQATRAIEGQARTLVLGPYILTEILGNGSLGTVYRAISRADKNAAFAVKVLPQRSVWHVRSARKQVKQFAEQAAHPAIVPFIDIGTAANLHYLVWPFIHGETLEARVNARGQLDADTTLHIVKQIVTGLTVCHQHELYHGLIKPSNLLLEPTGHAKLIDFGLGALLTENEDDSLVDTMSAANAAAGMLNFASPESIINPTERTTAGDQYSLGCLLFFCLTGRPPFPTGNAVEKMLAHAHVGAERAGTARSVGRSTPAKITTSALSADGRFVGGIASAAECRLRTSAGACRATTGARTAHDAAADGQVDVAACFGGRSARRARARSACPQLVAGPVGHALLLAGARRRGGLLGVPYWWGACRGQAAFAGLRPSCGHRRRGGHTRP
jgi:hypothetical protein